jgi:hypothetical protein
LARWRTELATPEFHERLRREIARCFATQSVDYELRAVHCQEQLAELQAQHMQTLRDVADLEAQRSTLVASISALTHSTSWRITAPLRWLRRMVARLAGHA